MRKRNGYSLVAELAIERVRQISGDVARVEVCPAGKKRLIKELSFHNETLMEAFNFRKEHGPEMNIADSDSYFREKLGGMISFAEMAVDPTMDDGNYSTEKILDNVSHYSYLVAKLVAANWKSISERPVSDRAIRDSSFDNREALHRLVNR